VSFWSQVSVVMIVLDAAELLPDALASIPAEAETIVADGGSRDASREVARHHGARVTDQDQAAIDAAAGNFDVARNAAAATASRPWVFFLDADERITPELAQAVAVLLPDPECNAFDMPRINLFWGRPVRLLGEDRQLRLLRRGHGRFEGERLHQSMQVDGRIGAIAAPLLHLNLRHFDDVRLRFRRYLPVEARQHPPVSGRLQALRIGLRMFRYYYVAMGAWRDGWRGVLTCGVYGAYHGAAAWRASGRADA
jgi:glycosyltransferase involved in cell wall biosynthesis